MKFQKTASSSPNKFACKDIQKQPLKGISKGRILLSSLFLLGFGTALSTFSIAAPAYAWKPNTHIYLAEEALKDAVDDCKISINRTDYRNQKKLGRLGTYSIDPQLCNSLRQNPQQYRAGLLGPDAYPDILTGQRVIHAEVSTPGGSNAWLDHIWTSQPRNDPRVQAFTLGFLTHAAGDMYAHTLINNYAGGEFSVGPNAVRHVVLEGYIGKRTPDIRDARNRTVNENSYSISGVERFIYDSMVNAQPNTVLADRLLIGNESSTSVPSVYSNLKIRLNKDIEKRGNCRGIFGIPNPICLAIKSYEKAWIKDIDAGLKEWPKVSHKVAKAIVFDTNGSSFSEADDVLSEYVNRHLLSMSGAPDFVGLTNEIIGNISDAIIPSLLKEAISQMKRDLLNYLLSEAFGITVDKMEAYAKNPERHFDRILNQPYGNAKITTLRTFNREALKLRDTGYSQPSQRFDYEQFPAAYNTVLLSKLIMLSPEGINQLLQDLGSSARLQQPNVMIGFIRSLDSDNEWHRHDNAQMVMAQDVCAYTNIFMQQDGERWQPNTQNCSNSQPGNEQSDEQTYKTGELEIPQTWTFDLDNGVVGRSNSTDLWFQAVTATERYLTPRNGTRLAIVGRRPTDLRGCQQANLSSNKLPMSQLTTGTYVCVLTNEGRYSQFQVTQAAGSSPGQLNIRYTTWKTPPQSPSTHKTGPLEIPQTWTFDLDNGIVGRSSSTDLWFEAVTATERYLTPQGGTRLAVVGRRSVNLRGCQQASLSSTKIPISQLTQGTYVCVLTSEGRYSQFRVNEAVSSSPGTLKIGYTTWRK